LDDPREIDRCSGNALRDEQAGRREDECQHRTPTSLLVVVLRTSHAKRSCLPASQQIRARPLPEFAVPASKGKHIGADTIKHWQGLSTS
jgi:hypothetical protein